MNNLKFTFRNDPQEYKASLLKLIDELQEYASLVNNMHVSTPSVNLSHIAHSVRNIAGVTGRTKLKIIAACWDKPDAAIDQKGIHEFYATIEEAIADMRAEWATL